MPQATDIPAVPTTPDLHTGPPGRSVFHRFFSEDADSRQRFTNAALCAICGIVAYALKATGNATLISILAGFAILFGGGRATVSAVRSLATANPDINFLMILAAAVSIVVGHWDEAVILLFLFSASDAVEHYAVQRTRRGIQSLMKLRPDSAARVQNGIEVVVPLEQLAVGDMVRIRPGDRVPVDGRIADGHSAVNESLITGESMPVEKKIGDAVFAGTMNASGSLLVRMTHPPQETTLQRIVHLVERAQESRGAIQRVIEKWQTPYVYAVIGMSLCTFLMGWIWSGSAGDAIYRAMLLLVAASPCAVILATPTAVLATVTRAAKLGILFKGGMAIERLASVTTIAFDKTGTLTRGEPVLEKMDVLDGLAEDRLLAIAAAVERHSEHPLAKGIVQAADQRGLPVLEITQFGSDPGVGVHAMVNGEWYGIGAPELFRRLGVSASAETIGKLSRPQGETAVLMLSRSGRGAVLILRDQPRPDTAAALDRLRAAGIQRFVMLTGDRSEPAQWVAERLGITEVLAGLTPEQKLVEIKRLAASGSIAMVGDGVNDAPALATATVGVAMGAVGSDVAIETADVVLMRDELGGLAEALRLARHCSRGIRLSLTIALGMISVLVVLTLIGQLPLPVAVVCHEGSTLLVVLNGLRLLRWPR